MGLLLDSYITLQIAETLIRSFLLMDETLVLSWNFCCRCREASSIKKLGELIYQAVSCFERTEREIVTGQP